MIRFSCRDQGSLKSLPNKHACTRHASQLHRLYKQKWNGCMGLLPHPSSTPAPDPSFALWLKHSLAAFQEGNQALQGSGGFLTPEVTFLKRLCGEHIRLVQKEPRHFWWLYRSPRSCTAAGRAVGTAGLSFPTKMRPPATVSSNRKKNGEKFCRGSPAKGHSLSSALLTVLLQGQQQDPSWLQMVCILSWKPEPSGCTRSDNNKLYIS